MNRNLVGSMYMYGRLCIKFPQSRMKGEVAQPDPKGHAMYCHHLAQVVVRKLVHFNLLL